MSNSNKKRTVFAQLDQSEEGSIAFSPGMDKRLRKVSPIGFRILVKIAKDTNVSEGGLYLPDGAKQNMDESIQGEVVEVASAQDDHSDQETNISGIPLGASVLISKYAGIKIPWDPDLRLVETKDVLAIIHEVNVD